MSGPVPVSIVVSTYEWPAALDVVLHALADQDDRGLEVVVADDGSGVETARVVERWSERFGSRLVHAWQPDEGWRRARVGNLGALRARGEYLLFLDGDSIPRIGMLEALRRAALTGWFVASKRLHLSPQLSRRVLADHVPVWRWSAARWLLRSPREIVKQPRESARPGVLVPVRDRRRPWRPDLPDFSPPHDAYGFFLGVHRADFERVNGFDLAYEGWGGEDEDLAFRLLRSGVRCGWPGPAATALHLWHEPRVGATNRARVAESRAGGHLEAERGLRELRTELAAQASA